MAQRVKRLPTMWETQVRSLGWEDPLEKEMATHSNTLAWKIPWTEKPGRLQSMGSQRVGHDFTFTFRAVKTGAQTWFTGKDHSGRKAGQDVPGKHVARETSQR